MNTKFKYEHYTTVDGKQVWILGKSHITKLKNKKEKKDVRAMSHQEIGKLMSGNK